MAGEVGSSLRRSTASTVTSYSRGELRQLSHNSYRLLAGSMRSKYSDFSLHHRVQTGSGALQVNPVAYSVSSPVAKRPASSGDH
jgi:hypothetical protein